MKTGSVKDLVFEHEKAWVDIEGSPRMSVGEFLPLQSEAANRWLTDEGVLTFTYSFDHAHFDYHGFMVISGSGHYRIFSGEEEAAFFLRERMRFLTEQDVRDFLDLFCAMNGYAVVKTKPELTDARVRDGEKIEPQDYSLMLQESDHFWKIDVSIEVSPAYSGSIYRYAITLPKEEEGRIKVKRGDWQYIADFIR